MRGRIHRLDGGRDVAARVVLAIVGAVALLTATGAGSRPAVAESGTTVHVTVTFASPPLAQAHGSRVAAARRIAEEQRAFTSIVASAIPAAQVRWRYRLVANGVSVLLPRSDLPRLEQLPGVARVHRPVVYTARAGPAASIIRASALPGITDGTAGEGMKIGIIDDGVDRTHPFFEPSGYAMPPGYPKGQVSYTSAKVIVARAFPPPGATWVNARKPFDPVHSGHATHVAGIAAGNAGTTAEGTTISGIAPRAYLGNYKALTIPTDAGVGLDGNAPELVAAIEAAVADGMDVINLSLGEAEIEASRDIVALALDAAADAGVVPVVAAGNDFDDFGVGSLTSPGSSLGAITVGAVQPTARAGLAGFSSSGPTPVSLRLKPDVVAPGVGILSSVPGGWQSMSGTSMAAPHVAGAAALLLQRHPEWSAADVKAALSATSRPVDDEGRQVPPLRVGAGLIDVLAADTPFVLPRPTSASFGLLKPGQTSSQTIELADAGAGAGEWAVTVTTLAAPSGATLTTLPTVTVPGSLALDATVTAGTPDGDLTGIVVLTRGPDTRRIPFWGRVVTPALARARVTPLSRPGAYDGNTRGRQSLATTYRYPVPPAGAPVSSALAGPEQVFRFRLDRTVENFGVVVTSRATGVRVEPRVVVAGNENRLTGYPALPLNLNPYLVGYGNPTPVAGAVRPARGVYDIVFDSRTRAGAGRFSFRFWVNDVTPPSARLLTTRVRRGTPIRVRVGDSGSGVDPASVVVRAGDSTLQARVARGELLIETAALPAGTKRLRVQVSDYQETRNMENTLLILPNTRVLVARVTILPRAGG